MSHPTVHDALQELGQPHVHLTYDSVVGTKKELPFVVGILGDFSGSGLADLGPLKNRRFVRVTLDQLDAVMSKMKAELSLAVPNELANRPDEYLGVTLRIETLSDFSPLNIIRQVPELTALMDARQKCEQLPNWGERLSKINEIDDRLTRQLRTILHHEKFQSLEGTWRGLDTLLKRNPERSDVEIRVLSCSKAELLEDFERVSEIEESVLYKRVYQEELGSVGGQPFSLLVGDYAFDNSSDDIDLLSAIAYVAGVALCPFITSPSTRFFGLDDWEQLPTTRGLTELFSGSRYVKWNSFRESDDARYVAFVLPRFVGRDFYGTRTSRIAEIDFQEVDCESDGLASDADPRQICWINGAVLLASQIIDAYVETGFCSRFIGPESGGIVQDLPGIAVLDKSGEVTTRFGAEVDFSGSHIAELADLGTIPVVNVTRSKTCVFFNGDTVLKPKTYSRSDANQNASAFAWLPYVLAVSRITHHLLAIVHDRLGSTGNVKQTQDLLNNWLRQSCFSGDASDELAWQQWPLRQGSVEVKEIPRDQHSLLATLRIQPWPVGRELNEPLTISFPIPRGR